MSDATRSYIALQLEVARACGLTAAAGYYEEALDAIDAVDAIERAGVAPYRVAVSGLGGGPAWFVGPPPSWHKRFVDAAKSIRGGARQ